MHTNNAFGLSIDAIHYLSAPSLHNLNGDKIDKIEIGQQSVIELSIHNNIPTELPFVVLVEIRDSNDVTTDLFWQSGSIDVNVNYTMETTWTPKAEGINYQIRSFAITDFENPQVLSTVTNLEGIIVESPLPHTTMSSAVFNSSDLSQPFIIADLSISEHRSINPLIELQSEYDYSNRTLLFIAANRGKSVQELSVDHWWIQRTMGGSSGYGYRLDSPTLVRIAPNQSSVITAVDLSVDDHGLTEQIMHEVELRGFNWVDEVSGNRDDYMISAEVSYHYDKTILAALGTNKLLEANNTLVIINGTGEPFEIDDTSDKIVDIYIANNGGTKISANYSGDSFRLWSLSRPYIEESYGTVADSFGFTECLYLEPGEKCKVTSLRMSKSYWPLGSLTGVPGTFVMYYLGYTSACTLESGEKIPGGQHLLIAVFDVR